MLCRGNSETNCAMKTAALITLTLASHAHTQVLYQPSDNTWG
jgi:hypothetical protein